MSYFDIEIIGVKNKQLTGSPKTKISLLKKKLGSGIYLIWNGFILEDHKSLSDYGIKDDVVICSFFMRETIKNDSKQDRYNYLLDNVSNILHTYLETLNSNPIDYELELDSLEEMGFLDREQNRVLLSLNGGNIETVANILLGI